MADLSTTYLGIPLKNPLIVSASPLSASLDNLQQMAAAGAAAVVLPSLFEEQINIDRMRLSRYVENQRELLPDDLKHIPNLVGYNLGLNGYLVHLYEAKKAVNIPVIASVNAYHGGGWSQYARILEAAGADALELNLYYLATNTQVTGAEVEQMYLRLVDEILTAVKHIPVAVKLSPDFSSLAHMAQQLDKAKVAGLVLFNRFYQPDFDIESRQVIPSLDLSDSTELRLRLRWAAILYKKIRADIALTGGVHTAVDVVKSLMAGAQVVMIASALFKHGIDHMATVLTGLDSWLTSHAYSSVAALRGCLSQQAVADPAAFERANYMNVLRSTLDPERK